MRAVLLLLAVLGLGQLRPAAAAQDDLRLEPLFETLRSAPTAAVAQVAELRIWQIWTEAPDSTNARLMREGTDAMARRNFPAALVTFNRLIDSAPGFAEAWNKRATLYYLMGNYAASIDDIEQTLALEPRHFGALSGLGLIMLGLDRPEAALRSFEAALAVHPHLAAARAHALELRRQLEGSPA